MSAPDGSTVINPLTTLVQSIVSQGQLQGNAITIEEAQDKVKAALGLDANIDLTSLDIVSAANTDTDALEAQKAAVMVATILVAAGEAAGADGAKAAIDAAIVNLAFQIKDLPVDPIIPFDLTDPVTITEIISAGLPVGTNVTDAVTILAKATDDIRMAANVQAIADIQEAAVVALDKTAPDAPTLTLDATSNTGDLTDLITADSMPTLRGVAEAASTIKIYDAGIFVDEVVADAEGNWEITVTLTPGQHALQASAIDATGNAGTRTPLSLVIDTNAAILAMPDLQEGSDSGPSKTDNRTKDQTPTLVGSGAESFATITLLTNNGLTVLGSVMADANGSWSITSSVLAEGSHNLSVKQTDVAGNVSTASADLLVNIDLSTVAPSITSAATATDTMPLLTGTAEAGASVAILSATGVQIGVALADNAGAWSYQFATPLNEGNNSFGVVATDLADNISITTSTTISVDSIGINLNGSNNGDLLTGTDRRDTLNGNGGNDILQGKGGNDRLFGNEGNDKIDAGAGNDWLAGGKGNDFLFGGQGSDVFVFGKSGGTDIISDFQLGIDKLKLEDGLIVKKQKVGDVNGDGKADLTIEFSSGSVILLGVDAPINNDSFMSF